MCGIAGIVPLAGAAPAPPGRIAEMCRTLVHRGPDEDGLDCRGGVAFGMRRLSIIDLEGGHQPLWNEDGTVRVIFNGEIYNYRELRADLLRRGHAFTTLTDGEVIPHLYEEHGSDFPRFLNGIFAIALHDAARRRVILARDHLGVKPLFFHVAASPAEGRRLLFGSEIKALLASGLLQPCLDLDALAEFLSWEYVPGPRTLFRGVRKLDAGTALEADLDSGEISERPYWRLPSFRHPEPATDAEWEERVDAALRRAVRRQLVSDVPLGAFLSGGVDSSIVTAAMGPARTFSIGFEDPSYDEVPWSRRVAEHLGLSHRVEILRPEALALFDLLMHYQEDPIGDFSIFPTYLVSRLAREEVTVVLSGDGGDELFGGYETYVAEERARFWRRMPALMRASVVRPIERARPQRQKKGIVNKAKRFIEGLEHDPALGHCRWRVFAGNALRSALFTPEALHEIRTPLGAHVARLQEEAGGRPAVDRGLYVDLRSYLVDNILVKVDRASMACSLEARVPYLDPEVVELAFRVPAHLKVHRGRTKILLRRVAARHVPRDCVYRPKEGFSIPIKNWLNDELRPVVSDLLDPARISADGIFRSETILRLRREHEEGVANHSHVLWGLLVFQDWRRRWRA